MKINKKIDIKKIVLEKFYEQEVFGQRKRFSAMLLNIEDKFYENLSEKQQKDFINLMDLKVIEMDMQNEDLISFVFEFWNLLI